MIQTCSNYISASIWLCTDLESFVWHVLTLQDWKDDRTKVAHVSFEIASFLRLLDLSIQWIWKQGSKAWHPATFSLHILLTFLRFKPFKILYFWMLQTSDLVVLLISPAVSIISKSQVWNVKVDRSCDPSNKGSCNYGQIWAERDRP